MYLLGRSLTYLYVSVGEVSHLSLCICWGGLSPISMCLLGRSLTYLYVSVGEVPDLLIEALPDDAHLDGAAPANQERLVVLPAQVAPVHLRTQLPGKQVT